MNQIVLIGRIKGMENLEYKNRILLEVERPFKENSIKETDVFSCELWTAIFKRVIGLCNEGDQIAIKGRIVYENDNYIVKGENVVLLNKSKNNILNK